MAAGDGKSDANIPYGIIRINDVSRAKTMLEEAVVSLSPDHNSSATEYDYQIRKLPSGNLMETLFGKAFNAITENYAVILKEYLILANTPADLKHLINAFYTQKTLDDNYNFQTFSENISDKSNMILYCNIRKSIPDIAGIFNPMLSDYIQTNKHVFQNLEGLAVQFSFINDMFFTNAYLKFNPDYREVNPSNWIAEVDARITGKPHLVRDHRSGKRNIIVFDELNTMYLIDHQGAVKWKIPLIQQPVSEVFMVDVFKNRKIQFLFNTPEYLYMIDIDGNYVADFPVKLPVRTTNSIAVFDYDKLKDYRIMFAGADNRIYNFDTRGNQVDGWNKPHVNQIITVPIQHIAADGKDFIVATDEKGVVYIYNRRGEVRITPEKSLQKAPNSIFYANKTNSKGALLTTDRQGNLCYLGLNGKISKTSFGDFSEGHYFLYTDFNNDNSFDFLFLDNSRLVVFDRMQKSITEQTLSESLLPNVVLFDMAGKNKTIGVVGKETGKVYLFDQGGAFEPSGYISGQTPFAAGSLNNDTFTNLVICEENKVFSYRLD